MMRGQLNEYIDTMQMPDFSNKETDPFWDPPEPVLIGKSYLQLKNLGYTLEADEQLKIFTTATNRPGGECGMIKCSYWPCDISGEGEPDDDLIVEDPQELLNKEIFFRVEIEKCIGLPEDLCKNVFVTYIFKHEPEVIYRVPNFEGKDRNPVFNYKHTHRFDEVNDYMLDYINNGHVSANHRSLSLTLPFISVCRLCLRRSETRTSAAP